MVKSVTHRGFTLVEMIVSVLLMSILFLYLYGSINNVKKTNEPYMKRSSELEKENKIFNLLTDDFLLASKISVQEFPKYDIVTFNSTNSLYQMQNPVITYVVSKNEKALLRIESFKKFPINEKLNIEDIIYTDLLVKNTLSFNVSTDIEYRYILLRAENFNPILLKLPKVN